ncbi:MAG TPA: NAD(P)H-hydrate dehydratase, partial [Pyrinomonadaceae bacterium]
MSGGKGKSGSGKEAASKRSVEIKKDGAPRVITQALLRGWPLPQPDEAGDKEDRGRVLVVGGAPEMPGAVVLAATAALRAGAGKLRIATCRSIAPFVAVSVPEARVFSLCETEAGAIAATDARKIAERANETQAVLIGPGMVDEEAVRELLDGILPAVEKARVILDAVPLKCLAGNTACLRPLEGRVILTPHAQEMAEMLGADEEEIKRDPLRAARLAADETRAVVALKGRETFIVAPDGTAYSNRAGNVGLATSGSGDVLSGIIAGLAARGAEPLQ